MQSKRESLFSAKAGSFARATYSGETRGEIAQTPIDCPTRTELVHGAFWTEAMKELALLLDRKAALLSRGGTEIEDLFPVTWA